MLDWEYKAVREAVLDGKCPIEAVLERRAERLKGDHVYVYELFVLEYNADFLRQFVSDEDFRKEHNSKDNVSSIKPVIAVLKWFVWRLDVSAKTCLLRDGYKLFFDLLDNPEKFVARLEESYKEYVERLKRAINHV